MEFKLTLLQNEIEHLNKNMGLMSEELVVLKEFIRQEFAQRFEAFSNARKERQRHQLENARRSEPSSTKTKAQPNTDSQQLSFYEIKTEPEIDQASFYDNDIAMNDNEDDSDNDSNYKFELYPTPVQTNTKKGKPKALIHKYFEHIPMPNGKVRTKCYTCQDYVSNQAQRLKKHFEKCSANNKVNMDSQVIKKITAIGYKRPAATGDIAKVGRKQDRVRELFVEIHDAYGFTKMKCSSCGHLVSNQANRMKNHIEKCERQSSVVHSYVQRSPRSPISSSSSSCIESQPHENQTMSDPLSNSVHSQMYCPEEPSDITSSHPNTDPEGTQTTSGQIPHYEMPIKSDYSIQSSIQQPSHIPIKLNTIVPSNETSFIRE